MFNVLLVDYRDENICCIKAVLENQGYRVYSVKSAGKALELASDILPDVVISCVMLNDGLDGLSLCRKWKNEISFKNIPFIIYSRIFKDFDDEQMVHDAGADSFFTLPFDREEFISVVDFFIKNKDLKLNVPSQGAEKSIGFKKYNNDLVVRLEKRVVFFESVFDDLHKKINELKLSSQKYKSIYDLHKKISDNIALDEVIACAIDGVKNCMKPDVVLIFIKENDTLIQKGNYYIDSKFERMHSPVHKVGECLCGLAAYEKKSQYAVNICNDPRCTLRECRDAGIISFAALPLMHGEEVLGVLGVASATEERDFEKQADFLNSIVDEITLSLFKSIIYENKSEEYSNLAETTRELQTEIIKRKQIELENKSLIKELMDKNNAMEQFVFSISHDLKSPLVTIEGFLEILIKDFCRDKDAQTKDYLERSYGATKRLRQIIDDILEMLKIGIKINIGKDKICLNELIQDVISMFEKQITNNKISIKVKNKLPVVVGSKQRIREVIINLIDNAIKFSKEKDNPRIVVGGYMENGFYICYVKDNGIGLKSEYLDKIFRLFEQINKDTEGHGVGLSISKKIMQTHGGDLWAESEGEVKGTSFFFSFPSNIVIHSEIKAT